MSTKTKDLFVIDCNCNDCSFHHKDEIYNTKEEAETELESIKNIQSYARVVTLYEQMNDIKYWYY